MIRIALPHDQNNVVWNNGDANIGFAYGAVIRICDPTCLSAKSGPARRNPKGEDLTVKGVKFQSCLSTHVALQAWLFRDSRGLTLQFTVSVWFWRNFIERKIFRAVGAAVCP